MRSTLKINTKKFMFMIGQIPDVTYKDLSEECGVRTSYFSELKTGKLNGIDPVVFKYVCLKYGFNPDDFKEVPKEEPVVVPVEVAKTDDAVMSGILNTLQSINKNQFEMIRILKSMGDTLHDTEGKIANCNVNTSETKKLLSKLCIAMDIDPIG